MKFVNGIMIGAAFMLLLTSVVLMILSESTVEYSNDLGCYDRYGNKIQGLKCSGEVYNEYMIIGSFISLLFGFMLLMMGLAFHVTGD